MSEAVPASVPPSGNQSPRSLIFLLGTLTVIGPFAIDMYLPALPRIGLDLHADGGAVQLTLSIFLLGLAAGQMFLGPVIDRWGRRRPLLWGLAAFVVAAVACARTQSMPGLIFWRLVMALGTSATMVVPRAVVRDHFNEHDSARMYSLLMLILGVSPIFAPSVGSVLVGWTGWRGIFWVLAGLAVICMASVMATLREKIRVYHPEHSGLTRALRTYGDLLADRRFLGPALVAGLVFGTIFTYLTGSSFVLIELHHLTTQQYAIAFGVNGVGLILASQLNRWLVDRWTTHQVLEATLFAEAMVGSALLVAGLTGWGGLPALLVLLFLNLAAAGIIAPNIAAMVMAPFGETAGSASALLGTIQFGLGSLAGALVGLLHNGTAVPMTAGCALCALAALAAWKLLALRHLESGLATCETKA
jgi:DHA1 family bicyclomycin/chloramphenicol resistance-like MFS transporter